jgi:hypothetical protein
MATTTRVYRKRHRSGSTTTWIKLQPGERAVILKPGQKALVIEEDRHYRLGGQVDDIVASHVLEGASHVTWCSVAQEWLDEGTPVVKSGIPTE